MLDWQQQTDLEAAKVLSNLSFWKVEPDVQLAELLRGDLARRAHQQILGLLVEREHGHIAQIVRAA